MPGASRPVGDLYREYWRAFDAATPAGSEFWMNKLKRERRAYWSLWQLGPRGVHVAAVILMPTRPPSVSNRESPPHRPLRGTRVELSFVIATLGRADAKRKHDRIVADLGAYESQIGGPLEVESHSSGQFQIGRTFVDDDPEDRRAWPAQHSRLMVWLDRFHRVFGVRG